MEKKRISKKTLFIVLGLFLIAILTVVGTYAYFGWNSTSENSDATVSVTSVNGLGQCNKATDNQKILWPVSNRNNGRIVTVSTKQTLSEYAYITWTLTIDSINTVETETAGLKHQSFKYELVNTTTGVSYGSGNFDGLDVGDTIIFESDDELLSYNTDYTFTLYLWIDGNMSNPMDMTNQTYEFSLVCDITGVSEINNSTSLSDFVYVLGSNQTTISTLSTDFYNQSSGTVSGQNNVTLPASITIGSDEVLLVRYIGSNTEVNIPRKYTVDGNTYKVVVLSYVTDGSNLSTGVFNHNTNIEIVNLSRTKYISLNSTGNGYDNNSMSNMFNSCTSLEEVSNIPNTITNLDSTFSGCTSLETSPTLSSSVTNINNLFSGCNSLSTLNLTNINLNNVTSYTNTLNGVSTTTTITTSDCDQYALFRSLFGYNYTNLSFVTNDNSNFNCYQKVQYIESTGTQRINTGYIPKTNTKLELELSFNGTFNNSNASPGTGAFLFTKVSNDNSYSINFGGGVSEGNKLYPWFNKTYASGASVQSFTITDAIRTNKNTLIVTNGNVKYGTVNKTITGKTADQVDPLYIFGTYTTPFDSYNMRVYKLTLSENGDVKKLFIPCYRIVDGTIGLYDTVNNVFYTNANTAANADPFTKGPDVNS